MEQEIKAIVELIDAAVMHGGDSGGAYFSDWEGLERAIGSWIQVRGLVGQYVPVKRDYVVSISPIAMSEICKTGMRACVALTPREIEEMEATGSASRGVGLPLILMIVQEDSIFDHKFETPDDRWYYYEIDWHRAEQDEKCVFYKDTTGRVLAYSISASCLTRIEIAIDRVEQLVSAEGYYVESASLSSLLLRSISDQGHYITISGKGKVYCSWECKMPVLEMADKAWKLYRNFMMSI